jgi:hypothetical protein
MVPTFLLPESVALADGVGAEIALGAACGKPLLLTLGITRIIEQESLDVSIYGSVHSGSDGEKWQLLTSFPQKFYCGTYSMLLDLTRRPEVRSLRAQWKMGRWGRGAPTPLFGFYLFADEAKLQVAGAA